MPKLRRTDGELSLTDVDLVARRIRGETAEALLRDTAWDPKIYLESFRGKSHPFLAEEKWLPVADSALAIARSLAITEMAVERLLAADGVGAQQVVFTASRIIELGGHHLIDDSGTGRPRVHLAAAKALGYFFTPPQVAQLMAREIMEEGNGLDCVLDPACGAGALLGAVLLEASNAGVEIRRLIGVELDDFTAALADRVLTEVASRLGIKSSVKILTGDGIEYLDQLWQSPDQPDAIIMNPPYGRVKFLADRLTNAETVAVGSYAELSVEASRRRLDTISRSSELRALANAHGLDGGPQDLYRLFLGLALDALATNGRLAAITPSGWMGDKHATRLRKKLIKSGRLRQLDLLPEDMRLFHTVNQETVVLVAGPKANDEEFPQVLLRTHDKSGEPEAGMIDLRTILRTDSDLARIPRIGQSKFELFERLLTGSQIGNASFLKNSRGELDLTQDRGLLREGKQIRVIRGDDLERYRCLPRVNNGLSITGSTYARDILKRPKGDDTRRPRIACRQISYLKKPRRLSWALVPEGQVLANSCNYVALDSTVSDELVQDTLYGLLLVLNSAVAEWQFRVLNSNNHVANYEIDSLPLPSLEDLQGNLAQMGRFLLCYYDGMSTADSTKPGAIEDFADALVARSLGLSADDIELLLTDLEPSRSPRVSAIHRALDHEEPGRLLSGSGWFQHQYPTLSPLDLQMITHVPQGGNWQDIPVSVPSERLHQIREMTKQRGVVRTTYYGRLRPDQPAYTIATYFNRPGNGTNIHPWEDRTITAREAARLQSFPDWYIFAGNDGAVRNQIGNAVPPRLAFAIGNHLRNFSQGKVAIDMFAGAGGLSCGLELAGWDVVAAVDNDASAARTYRLNRPIPGTPPSVSGTQMIEADLLTVEGRARALSQLQNALDGKKLNAVFGGPPCQGFSTAGWRQEHDSRNDLAVIFLDFVRELDPEIVVLENVEGLLSYGKGRVLRELLSVFAELGYQVPPQPWVLAAETYGVPQMRRRVFLVGHKDLQISEPQPTHDKCLGRREQVQQLELALTLPYPITAAEALLGLPRLGPHTHPSMGSRELREDFHRWLTGDSVANA